MSDDDLWQERPDGEEDDPTKLIQLLAHKKELLIQEFIDLSGHEKSFIQLWNTFSLYYFTDSMASTSSTFGRSTLITHSSSNTNGPPKSLLEFAIFVIRFSLLFQDVFLKDPLQSKTFLSFLLLMAESGLFSPDILKCCLAILHV